VTSEYEFWMSLGGFLFLVQPLFHNTRYFCRDYRVPENTETVPDAVITVTQEDLEAEKARSPFAWVKEEGMPADTVGSFCELTVVHREIGDYLSYHDASVFHGVLLELDGEGYLFTAKSGTGKSTQAMNWLKRFPTARIINGDKPILHLEENRLMGYGTPWCGKEQFQVNTKVPVRAVILIERDEENCITRLSDWEMLPTWMTQTYKPDDSNGMERVIDTALQMMSTVGLFRLRCNMDPDSAIVAKQGIDLELNR